MSREGLIFKKFVDKVLLEQNRNDIKTYYLPASRKVCSVASLINRESIKEVLNEPMVPTTCSEILEHRFGLNEKDCQTILGNISFDPTILLHQHSHKKELNNLIVHGENIILKNSEKVRNLLKLYYLNLGIPSKENIYVDIGYRGTMQHLLNKIFNSDIKFKFIYLLINNKVKLESKKAGYYFFYKYSVNSIISQNRLFLEYLFMPMHGTLLGFEEKEKEIIPIWQKLDDIELVNLKYINSFQEKALKIYFDGISIEKNKDILHNLIIPHDYDFVKQFENFFIEDNFGGLSQRKMLAVPILLNNIKINKVTLFELLMLSEWKEGALFIIKESKIKFKEKDDFFIKKNTGLFRKLRKLIISPNLFLLDSQFNMLKNIGYFLTKFNENKTIKERFDKIILK